MSGQALLLLFTTISEAVEQALRFDAACLCINLLLLLRTASRLRSMHRERLPVLSPYADDFGMPLMIEPFVMQDDEAGGYMVDGPRRQKIMAFIRQAAD